MSEEMSEEPLSVGALTAGFDACLVVRSGTGQDVHLAVGTTNPHLFRLVDKAVVVVVAVAVVDKTYWKGKEVVGNRSVEGNQVLQTQKYAWGWSGWVQYWYEIEVEAERLHLVVVGMFSSLSRYHDLDTVVVVGWNPVEHHLPVGSTSHFLFDFHGVPSSRPPSSSFGFFDMQTEQKQQL